ncbi:reverse transcriptase [Gossypium australe]|uniref:Reverse transcriptase n=1 Tax=Gossypium australe TaxID=47621 RepID=A0A5B6WZN5_9ROSI|nr:reverse transcriptase [Gossypium australe]
MKERLKEQSILFGRASKEGILVAKAVVNEHEKISGQLVNFDKSSIYFSNNISEETNLQLEGELGVRVANNPKKYLGLPKMVCHCKKNTSVEIKEIFLTKMKSWSARNLSIGGKDVFIKAILQASPTYAIECFNLHVSVCRELENFMCKFWWRNLRSCKGIHWCSWISLCIPKVHGGTIFRDLSHFNKALLARQG